MESNYDNGKIDLHIHSVASDGTLTPRQLIEKAVELKIKAISITDHDTIEGCISALTSEIPSSLNFITGIEISVNPPIKFGIRGSIHVLGYNINIYNRELNDKLSSLQRARDARNFEIIKKLNELGKNISIEDAAKEAASKIISRNHIAKALVKKGYASSINEAFDLYISNKGSAYAQKERLSCEEAITLIKNAGGIAVLAHPYLLELNDDKLEELVKDLKSVGLEGIEVYYPEHTKEQALFYEILAERFSLLKTGGSDFHGDNKPQIEMGIGKGDFFVDFKVYKDIIDYFKKTRKIKKGKIRTLDNASHEEDISGLEKNIGYSFKNKEFLVEALSHSSFAYEHQEGIKSNERLEFLGDAVLNLAAAHILMEEYPDVSEGMLTQIRTGLVKESVLAELAKKINLGAYIRFGKGEMLSEGWNKPSILEDALEALIAAIYIDSGLLKAFEFVKTHFAKQIKKGNTLLIDDYKTRLQEFTQEVFKSAPVYRLIDTEGPKHKKKFSVEVTVENFSAQGVGDSKKKAEQDAAYNILYILKK